jgi:hypothetical protein
MKALLMLLLCLDQPSPDALVAGVLHLFQNGMQPLRRHRDRVRRQPSGATRTLKLWVGLAGRPYAGPGGAEHPEPVSNRINRFGNYVINPDRFPEPLEQHLGFSLSPGRNSPLPFFTSWVLQLASLQQSRCLSASLQPPLPVFAPPASA